jgi:hypothetical protein
MEWILEVSVDTSAIELFQNFNITFHSSNKLPIIDNVRVICVTFTGAAYYRQRCLKGSRSGSQELSTNLAVLTHLFCCFLLYVKFEILFRKSYFDITHMISWYLSNRFTVEHNRNLVRGDTKPVTGRSVRDSPLQTNHF